MNRRTTKSLVILGVFIAIPTLYNACGAVGKSADLVSASACGANSTFMDKQMEDGRIVPRKTTAATDLFASQKTQLGQTTTGAAGVGRKTMGATLDPAFAANSRVAVLVDGTCLRSNAASLLDADGTSIISRAALANLRDDLDRQSFSWTVPTDMTASQIAAQADAEACVVGVTFDRQYKMQSLALNDPRRTEQTYLAADNADAAYQTVFRAGTGLALTGSATIVAVIDTGADLTHPDLVGHLWRGPNGPGFDLPGNGYYPTDVSPEGHGTHVAGMIAAVSNNSLGISGVMPYRAMVMPIKIFAADGAGGLTTSSNFLYNAIRLAVANGATVINMSLGSVQTGSQSDALTQQALSDAVAAGVTVVTVIGNANNSSGTGTLIDNASWSVIPGMFATMQGVIGVGSIDVTGGGKSTFSNYSPLYAEIAAPGAQSGYTGLLSTIPQSLGTYGTLAGTSQAAPQVAAAAAMTIAIIRSAYGVIPSPAEVERLILTSSSKQSGLTSYFKDGNRLDLNALVNLIKLQYPKALTGVVVGGC